MEYGAPISQVDIEQEIIRFVNMLEEETENFELLAKDHAKKDANYKSSWAKAFLAQQEGSVKHRESWADYETADARFDAQVADALMRAKREKLSSLRTSIDALRTLAANVRSLVT